MRNVDYQLSKDQTNNMKEEIKLKGWYEFNIIDVNGNVRDSFTVDNSIMNAGLAQLASLAGDASATPFTYLALGTSSTAVAASQTALQAEITDTGLARASATVSRVTTTQTNDTLQEYYEWTASGSKTIEEVGIFNASSAGVMLSRALTSTKTVTNGEKINVTYKVKFA